MAGKSVRIEEHAEVWAAAGCDRRAHLQARERPARPRPAVRCLEKPDEGLARPHRAVGAGLNSALGDLQRAGASPKRGTPHRDEQCRAEPVEPARELTADGIRVRRDHAAPARKARPVEELLAERVASRAERGVAACAAVGGMSARIVSIALVIPRSLAPPRQSR